MIWSKILKVEDRSTFIIIILSVAVVWNVLALPMFYLWGTVVESGRLGDTFGMLTSFFTALAFGGLVYTIFLQKKELSETRQEFKEQNRTLKQQQFESTFFQLINNFQNLTNGLVGAVDGKEYSGRRYFEALIDHYLHDLKYEAKLEKRSKDGTGEDLTPKNYREIAKSMYESMYNDHQPNLDPWLNGLEVILRYVHKSEDKETYVSILRAMLSPYEVMAISGDVLYTEKNRLPLKKLVNEYKVLILPKTRLETVQLLDIFLTRVPNANEVIFYDVTQEFQL